MLLLGSFLTTREEVKSQPCSVSPCAFYAHRVLPLDPGGEAVGQFVEGTRILAFNLAPAPKVIAQLLQLLALLLQLQVENLQLVHKLRAHL